MSSTGDPGRRAVWAAGLVVATGAGVATAHGLFQVAAAARVPTGIAWLYPLITDGLALVAYAATARLHDGGRRYAAAIVVLAAGLSGLAQAVFLVGGLRTGAATPPGLRFGVGAWPAIAAALTAHLLHLIGTDDHAARTEPAAAQERSSSNPTAYNAASNEPSNPPLYTAASNPVEQPRPTQRPNPPVQPDVHQPLDTASKRMDDTTREIPSGSARDRARAAARGHHDRHGALPTVTELMRLAAVARGTAGNALKDLRAERPALHVVNADRENRSQQ